MFQLRDNNAKAIQRDRTFENCLGWDHILSASHAGFESGRLIRFVGVSKLRVEKSLGQITGAFGALVEAIKAH